MRFDRGIRLAVAIGLGGLFFLGFSGFVPAHSLHGDEIYYIGRAMQNLAFLEGHYPPTLVTFSNPNHPLTGELLMGLGMLAQGQTFSPSRDPFGNISQAIRIEPDIPLNETDLTSGELGSARSVSLLVAAMALIALVYLGAKFTPVAGLFGFLVAISSPGLLDISTMAMLDVYCAVFTFMSVLLLYWYTRGYFTAILTSGVFLGLAVGSKLSLDPFLAGAVIMLSVFVKEKNNIMRLKRLGQNWVAAILAFAGTSPVVILRLPEQLLDSLGSSARRTALSNLWTNQTLFSEAYNRHHYGIFSFLQPPVLAVYALLATSAVILMLSFLRAWNVQDDKASRLRGAASFLRTNPDAFFLITVTTFCALDLLLSPLIFEYGRNFQRLSLYVALSSTVSFAYLTRNLNWKAVGTMIAGACFTVVLLVNGAYLDVLRARLVNGTFSYASFGHTVVVHALSARVEPEVGALLLLSSALIIVAFFGVWGSAIAGQSDGLIDTTDRLDPRVVPPPSTLALVPRRPPS